ILSPLEESAVLFALGLLRRAVAGGRGSVGLTTGGGCRGAACASRRRRTFRRAIRGLILFGNGGAPRYPATPLLHPDLRGLGRRHRNDQADHRSRDCRPASHVDPSSSACQRVLFNPPACVM